MYKTKIIFMLRKYVTSFMHSTAGKMVQSNCRVDLFYLHVSFFHCLNAGQCSFWSGGKATTVFRHNAFLSFVDQRSSRDELYRISSFSGLHMSVNFSFPCIFIPEDGGNMSLIHTYHILRVPSNAIEYFCFYRLQVDFLSSYVQVVVLSVQ